MIKFMKTVWAVGQGGMASGVLWDEGGDAKFSYVYDCGSNQQFCFEREIAELRLLTDHLNIVFLSHLDADHLNGFEKVAALFDLTDAEIVLPQMDPDLRLLIAATLDASGVLTGTLLAFLDDPELWIRTRAPSVRITRISNIDVDDDNRDPIPLIDPDVGNSERGVSGAENVRVVAGPVSLDAEGNETHRWKLWHAYAEPTNVAVIELITHSASFSKKRVDAFKKSLHKNGFDGAGLSLVHVLSDVSQRKVLRDCFDAFGGDHNLVSLHLLVRNIGAGEESYASHHGERLRRMWRPHRLCFLFSGDAKLSTPRYYDQWHVAFSNYLEKVTFFSVPHHGAIGSFNIKLLTALSNAEFFAQCGTNGYGHPSESVVSNTKQIAYKRLYEVDEHESNRIYQTLLF